MTMYMNHLEIAKFRETTLKSKNDGIQFKSQYCHKCKQIKALAGGKRTKGYSRHQPSTFTCKECHEANGNNR